MSSLERKSYDVKVAYVTHNLGTGHYLWRERQGYKMGKLGMRNFLHPPPFKEWKPFSTPVQ